MPRSMLHTLRKQKQLIAFVAIVLAVLGFGVVTYFVNLREKSYDNSSQGFRQTGGVGILQLAPPSELDRQFGRKQELPLRFSTQQAPISGIQIIVDVKGNGLDGIRFEPAANISGLQLMGNVVESIEGGKRIKVAFASNPLTTPFNNNVAFTTLGHYIYNQPTGAATFEFLPATKSTAPETGADTLAAPAQTLISYHTIEITTGATPTSTTVSPTPTTSTATSPTPTTSTAVSPTPTTSTKTTPTPTPTPTPTATAVANNNAGTGGTQNVVVLSCNSECTSHAQCPVNTFCSNGRCRNTACSGSENCTCPTSTPRASTAFTGPSPTPRSVAQAPRTQPRAQGSGTTTGPNKGGDDVFVDPGLDPELAESAALLEERMQSPTPTPISTPVVTASDSQGFSWTVPAGIGALLLALMMFVLWRRRNRHPQLTQVPMKSSPVSPSVPTPPPARPIQATGSVVSSSASAQPGSSTLPLTKPTMQPVPPSSSSPDTPSQHS